jgi:hypothetical protein
MKLKQLLSELILKIFKKIKKGSSSNSQNLIVNKFDPVLLIIFCLFMAELQAFLPDLNWNNVCAFISIALTGWLLGVYLNSKENNENSNGGFLEEEPVLFTLLNIVWIVLVYIFYICMYVIAKHSMAYTLYLGLLLVAWNYKASDYNYLQNISNFFYKIFHKLVEKFKNFQN